jgi:hypothetical protein
VARPSRRAAWLAVLLVAAAAALAAGVGLLSRAGRPGLKGVTPDDQAGQAELLKGTGPPLVVHHVRDDAVALKDAAPAGKKRPQTLAR